MELQYKYELSIYKNGEIRVTSEMLKSVNFTSFYKRTKSPSIHPTKVADKKNIFL